MYDVVALGELLIDFATISTDADSYPTMQANPGGAPGNFLAALACYGAKTASLGKVGTDTFGQLILSTIARAGIHTCGIVQDDHFFTTLAFVTFDAHGDRAFSFARKPGADTQLRWEEIDQTLIEQCRAFHFGTLSLTCDPVRETTRKAVAFAKEQGKLITFDPNLRLPLWPDAQTAKREILWGMQQADVVKISDEELEFLWGCGAEDGARRLIEEYGVSLVMATCGSKGCLLMNRNYKNQTSCPVVCPIDTTGAGDIFGGSAVSRLLKLDKPLESLNTSDLKQIARFAVTAASLSTEKLGGIPSIPAEEVVLARINMI